MVINIPAWKALQEHRKEMETVQMRGLFERDPQRFDRFSLHLGDILFDYSKNRITEQTMKLLVELARQVKLGDRIEAMFNGERIIQFL